MKRHIKLVLGAVFGGVLLWLAFRGAEWRQVFEAIAGVNLWWLAAAHVPIGVSFWARIRRWGYVVRTGGPVSDRVLFSATQIAFLANIVLPGRLGELIRALVLARLSALSFSKSLAMATLDRVNDLIGLMAVLGAALYAFRAYALTLPAHVLGVALPPDALQLATAATGAAIAGAAGALVLLYVNQRLALRLADALLRPFPEGFARRVHRMLEQFAQGLHIFRSGGDLARSIAYSLLVWGCFVAANECMLRAFHVGGPWYAPFVYTTFVAVAISVPGAPGFVGQYHFAVVAMLAVVLPGAAVERAQALALVAHVVNTIPVVGLGLYALYLENMSLAALRRQTEATPEAQRG